MKKKWLTSLSAVIVGAGLYSLTPSRAQEPETPAIAQDGELAIPVDPEIAAQSHVDPECTFFGARREHFMPRFNGSRDSAAELTRAFSAIYAGHTAAADRPASFVNAQGAGSSTNPIDQYIWADLQSHGITPAAKTTDLEFIRRVTLDLTGRIPTSAAVTAFAADLLPNKRAAVIDTLLASPQWVDKWTMFYGDLYKNTAANTQIQLRPEGRNAFYKWIHDSLASAKPYNEMAAELIAAAGTNSFDQANGQINYLVLGVVNGGPTQDIFDQQTANIADEMLGLAHVNCLLCHNGHGHLDSLSLWGSQTTRAQAWGLAAFMAHTNPRRVPLPADPANPNANKISYWSLNTLATGYRLNTTTGNRPARQPIGTITVINPSYLFTGQAPAANQDYRAALAKYVTSDFQFSRAAVNYVWAQLFGVGIVDPPDQFDPARLDPANPPPSPWTLQPSNAALLNALAQWFIDNNYDLRGLMRLIVNSDTYQLASEYNGAWDPAWNQYFARKFVRRLWSEEVHDSVVTATGILPSYTVPGFSADSAVYGANSPGFGKISWAMQAPDVVNMPDGNGAVSQFLNSFLRGNRDDQARKGEGSILQALGLMNNNFIESRIHSTGAGAAATYLARRITQPDTQLINTMFLDVLSRYPNAAELQQALTQLATGSAAQRTKNAEDLLWTLFNKVDFAFNY